ncbi:precorrin-6A/cobalt-precorrin-6A reductase [Anaerobacterium chartisolvens]|uniref:Precorrin-6A/cobalt-precorrin-6A reductase n=1 Tax=Anaerobacterium chartisolvens TaxID=1297424 RepID=A0A369B7R4_9FIRM|nr:precorrin-6A/cobalt-precorrin-6A reductase [Anaerobacterium chartisolvens]
MYKGMQHVIVIAGTSDARQIIEGLARKGIRVTATVATDFGGSLIETGGGVSVLDGRLCAGEMARLVEETGAKCVVDASHPYAAEASSNAISACRLANVPYYRFERACTLSQDKNIIWAGDFHKAAQKADEFDGNVFLTVGSNNIEVFARTIRNSKKRLFARVLPQSEVILRCEQAGLDASSIIAAKGPFSPEMNIEMLKHCKAAVMVAKDSGAQGGTPQKLLACADVGIPVIMVRRPELEYTNKTGSIDELLEAVVRTASLKGGG